MISSVWQTTEWLLLVAIAQQSLESLAIPAWDWEIVENEISRVLRPLLKPYKLILFIRIAAALSLPFLAGSAVPLILLVTTWLVAVRWRGTFNGGSDQMTAVLLLALVWARFDPSRADMALGLIAIQATLSYVVAGFAKVRQRDWRSGEVLREFFPPSKAWPRARLVAAWSIMTFECLFPLAMLNAQTCLIWLTLGALFHLINAYVLGLNRFFFAWIATYPALVFVSRFLV